MLYLIQHQTLEAIADKVREKTGQNVNLTPEQMASLILSELEKVSGDKLAIGDGEYDVRNAARLLVQNDLNPESILYYEYDDAATALTISVNPNPSSDYDAIDIDKLLGDLYIGRNVRSYTTPIMPGMTWLMNWLTAKEITTFADYKKQASPAWYFYQRAQLCLMYRELLREAGGLLPEIEMLDTGSYHGVSGTITDDNGNVIGTVFASYDSTAHTVQLEYSLYHQHGVDTVNIKNINSPELVVASVPLPFGMYFIDVKNVQFSGSAWTGTWPFPVTFRFAGGLEARPDVVLDALSEQAGEDGSISDAIDLAPEYAAAGKMYVVIDPSFASQIDIETENGASITVEFGLKIRLWNAYNPGDEDTASLADVLRYADTMSPRYKLRCLGANYPTLVIDPDAHTAKGYPVDAVDHLINNQAVTPSTENVVISTRCAPFTNEDRDGNDYDVNSMKTTYRPNGYCYGVLSNGANGETSGYTYRSYQYSVCRKSDADG